MKSKAKLWLLLGLTLLLTSLVAGCASEPKDYPSITAEQVISRVQVYGVPTIRVPQPMRQEAVPVNPVGQWAAIYEGNQVWRVQGKVVANNLVRRYGEWVREPSYHSTTWLHTNTTMELILWDGRPLK